MKSIKEWLETLPEPYRSEALSNNENMPNFNSDTPNDARGAVFSAFVWSVSPQGSTHWQDLCDELKAGTVELNNSEVYYELW